jgi:hypothetical protein
MLITLPCVRIYEAVPYLRQLVDGLSPWSPGSHPGQPSGICGG